MILPLLLTLVLQASSTPGLAVGSSSPTTDSGQLAQERGRFGLWPIRSSEPEFDSQRFANYSFGIPFTRILYPSGYGDRRYLFSTDGGPLIYETRTGEGDYAWRAAELESSPLQDRKGVRVEEAGTLELVLAQFGYRVKEPIPDDFRVGVKEVTGYAWYMFDNFAGSLGYAYVFPNGTFSEFRRVDIDENAFAGPHLTYKPYPISIEEREALRELRRNEDMGARNAGLFLVVVPVIVSVAVVRFFCRSARLRRK